MKKGFKKTMDEKAPRYEEECGYINDMKIRKALFDKLSKQVNGGVYGKWKQTTTEWTKPCPTVMDHPKNIWTEQRNNSSQMGLTLH
jgi:hypothetical protein